MSRKRIVAATMIAAALGLAFAGYTATRANGTDDVPEHLRPSPLKADAGYRQNHQIGHDGAVFKWMDATAGLTQSPNIDSSFAEVPMSPREPGASGTESDELTSAEIEHATHIGADTFAGLGPAGGGGGTWKTGDDWGGARYGGGFGGLGGFGGFYGAGGGGGGGAGADTHTKGTSGSNNPSNETPQEQGPSTSTGGTGDQPGTANPKPGDPPAGGAHEDTPANTNPPAQQQNEDSQGSADPSSPNEDQPNNDQPNNDHPNGGPNDGDHAGAPGGGAGTPGGPGTPGDPGAPGGDPGDSSGTPIGGDLPGHPTNPPGNVHSVPEPATLGLLGFGIVAAAALRRRRRS